MSSISKRCYRREKEGLHAININVDTLLEVYDNVCEHYDYGRIGGTDYYILTSVLFKVIYEMRKELECFGCEWRYSRHQKCISCVRNRKRKDNYKHQSFL